MPALIARSAPTLLAMLFGGEPKELTKALAYAPLGGFVRLRQPAEELVKG